ncbi:hypothetical protein HMPREF9622_00426 [Cutibacterium modestum HL037PA3]|nr:hypothetical protein HMPREF9622_00426 [Cutibacterium modestum HL037PA3]
MLGYYRALRPNVDMAQVALASWVGSGRPGRGTNKSFPPR